jgi:pimeloyl-ACP methyl ester carboxylesterase
MEENTFDTGKIVLNYASAGPGARVNAGEQPALVLLHGGSGRWQMLEDFMVALSQHWHVYAPDLRGHGKSGRAAWSYTLKDYAADIALFLQQVSGPAFVYGHSLGGIVALMTAALYPEQVHGVLVGDAPLDSRNWKSVMQGQHAMVQCWRDLSGGAIPVTAIAAALKDAPLGSPVQEPEKPLRMLDVYPDGHPVYLHLAERLYQHDPDVLGMLLEDFDHTAAGYEMETLLPVIRCPVLLLQADPAAGAAMSDTEVERAMQLLKQPTHVRFAGLSHLMNIEDPQAVLQAIESFLSAARNSSPDK